MCPNGKARDDCNSDANGLGEPPALVVISVDSDSPTKRKWRRNQYFAAVAANFGALAFGIMSGWSATALPGLREDEAIGMKDPESQSQWIGSLWILGALVSGPLLDYFLEHFGRRWSMLGLSAPCLGGWTLILLAQNVEMVYVGRFLTGVAGGAFTIVSPIYVAETSDPDIRGKLGSGFDMGIASGILYIETMGAFLPWRMQALAAGAVTVLGHILLMFVVESPRFLMSKGRAGEATRALCWLHTTADPKEVQEELHELEELTAVQKDKEEGGSWKDLFSLPILKPCSIALSVHFFSAMTGNIAITAYTVDIFRSAEIELDVNYATMIFGFINVVAALVVAALVDWLGRRPLLIISQFVMALCLAGTGCYFWLKESGHGVSPSGLGWLPVTSLAVFIGAFAIGTGPISYMLMGEILPPKGKGLGASIITIVKWATTFATVRFFTDVMQVLNESGGYWFYCGWCVLGGLYVLFFVPETKGKTLEEIQEKFQKR